MQPTASKFESFFKIGFQLEIGKDTSQEVVGDVSMIQSASYRTQSLDQECCENLETDPRIFREIDSMKTLMT